MKTFKIAAAQGEVNVRKIDAMPAVATKPLQPEKGLYIVGHSESGHHHGFRAQGGVAVMERTEGVPAGMQAFYAVLNQPTALEQNAASPHEALMLDEGIYEIRISREYDPFAEQARRVAD